jgi:hypothetical protein
MVVIGQGSDCIALSRHQMHLNERMIGALKESTAWVFKGITYDSVLNNGVLKIL